MQCDSFQAREHCLTLLQSALEDNVNHCWMGSESSCAGAAHLCAVSTEYELFSGSKLSVSYKAAVMKRVNEIKKSTGLRELHAALMPHTGDGGVDSTVESTATSHALMSSVDNLKSFSAVSPGDVTADDGAANIVHYTYCDKDDSVTSSLACMSKSYKESDGNCDVGKSADVLDQCGIAESISVSEPVTCNRNTENFVGDDDDDDDGWTDKARNSSETPHRVIHSHDINHWPQILVKSESLLATDAADKSVSAVLKTSKSVRISESPPTVSYIDCQHKEVRNGASKSILKVSWLLHCVCLHVLYINHLERHSLQVDCKTHLLLSSTTTCFYSLTSL